jgi:phage-related protein
MATSCNNFAQAIKDAHNKLVDELSEFAAEFVVGEIVFGVLVEVGGELWGNAAMAVRGMAIAQRCARIIEKLVELAKNAARVARRAAESIADVVGKIRSTIEALVNRVPSVVGKDVKTLTRAHQSSASPGTNCTASTSMPPISV